MAEAVPEALAHALVEHRLAGVAEGRVAEVVAEPDRLGQVLVEAERPGDVAGDAAGLERVRQPGAVVVALGRDEDLRLVLEPAERLRVHDAVAVALEGGAVIGIGLLLRAPGGVGASRQRREVGLPALDPLAKRGAEAWAMRVRGYPPRVPCAPGGRVSGPGRRGTGTPPPGCRARRAGSPLRNRACSARRGCRSPGRRAGCRPPARAGGNLFKAVHGVRSLARGGLAPVPAGGRLELRAGPQRAASWPVAEGAAGQRGAAEPAGVPDHVHERRARRRSVNGTGRAAPAAATDGFAGVRNHEQVSGS